MAKEKDRPRVLLFSSGTKTGGGSGVEAILRAERGGTVDYSVAALVSHHELGGVRKFADEFGKSFFLMEPPFDAASYQNIFAQVRHDLVVLSGWLKPVYGHDPQRTINKHPGRLPDFGGKGMHGVSVHRKVLEEYRAGRISSAAFSMHFVVDDRHVKGDFYDAGPVFFESPEIPLRENMTESELEELVKDMEHRHEPEIIGLVASGAIRWNDVNDLSSLSFPKNYSYLPKALQKK